MARYLPYAKCKEYNVQPGSILRGAFTGPTHLVAPHIEDLDWSKLEIVRSATPAEFKSALEASLSPDISVGFGLPITSKLIPTPLIPSRSIITLKIQPNQIQIVEIEQNGRLKLRANVALPNGTYLSRASITDLGFFDSVGTGKTISVSTINAFIKTQKEIILRLGIGRTPWPPDDDNGGYWIQVNGIYTFPDYEKILRTYK
ncbi:MAG: hypothetical protein K2Q19_07820 [Rhodocyclaceae bacterium]|nr:hypothetical protein [Rhodocyclaceae bacterium]